MGDVLHEEDEFNRRMSNQLDPKIKADRADFVLRNNGTTEELRLDAVALYNALIQNHKEGVVLE